MASEGSDDEQHLELQPAALRHRLRTHLQNLGSLINLQARRAQHAETVQALEDLRARFSVTSLHVEFDEGDGKPLALEAFLARIAQGIAALYDPMGRHPLSPAIAPQTLPASRALALGQALAELLIAAYRHRLAGRIGGRVWVDLTADSDKAVLIVADDGDAAADPRANEFGFGIVRSLAGTLGGAFEHERDAHAARLRFPLRA
jgi:two-component sensor histidine kinase